MSKDKLKISGAAVESGSFQLRNRGFAMNYYNEFDHKAAMWLKELIKEGVIPDGVIDERSITDVRADDLRGFTQCHFFAGVGGWPLALKMAGIQEDFRCWTGSCPCQPFSNAGKRKGIKDERDLWPAFGKLIADAKPELVFGEQVANAIREGWIDRVHADLEAENYTCGEIVLGAHSVGAPHIRQRLYWGASRLALPKGCGYGEREHRDEVGAKPTANSRRKNEGMRFPNSADASASIGLAQDSASLGRRGRSNADSAGDNGQIQAQGLGDGCRLANNVSGRCGERRQLGRMDEIFRTKSDLTMPIAKSGSHSGLSDSDSPGQRELCRGESVSQELSSAECAGLPSFSPWSDFGLVLCRDTDKQGRHRVRRVPAESILLSVANGVSEDLDGMRYQSICEHPERAFPLCAKEAVPGRAMLLKGFGNAIVPELAAEFIKAFLMEVNSEQN